MMNFAQHPRFGMFKPAGHVVVSFPTQEQALRGARALAEIGIGHQEVQYLSDRQMLDLIDHDLDNVCALTRMMQELKRSRAQREQAQLDYHWLVVRATNDGRAAEIAGWMKPLGAERVQYHGRLILDQLIEPTGDMAAVAEAPGPKTQSASDRSTAADGPARPVRALRAVPMQTAGRAVRSTPGAVPRRSSAASETPRTHPENEDADPVGDGHSDAEFAATQASGPRAPSPAVPAAPPDEPDEDPHPRAPPRPGRRGR
jgi:hypothetical protein